MTTTNEFQIKPDYYTSEKECIEGEKKVINTNPRYKFFCQTHFTAGDIEQFKKYRDQTNGKFVIPKSVQSDFQIPKQVYWSKYKDLDVTSVDNTFKYLFYKFKKGIFVKIKDGKLTVFLPFSNKNFVNEWSNRIKIDPKFQSLNEFMKHITTLEGYKFSPNKINKFIDNWYANNCLLRCEYPIYEGDTNAPNTSDMFKTLCEERNVPDIEFFVNRRDFPLLKTNGTEPYNHIYDTNKMKLSSHEYSKYTPILSMVTAKNFADIPIPTGDDWARVCVEENKFFPHSSKRLEIGNEEIPWEKRKPIAVFRGSSTGHGVTIETNPRLKLAYISTKNPHLLDAGITKWNLRPRKIEGHEYIQTIDIKSLPFGLKNYISPEEQAKYKYVINVDGHVASFRLSRELQYGMCVLLVKSKFKLWYKNILEPFVHYVPVNEDLSDLIEKIKWCQENDDKCKEIAKNSLEFSKKYLTKNGILDYLQKILVELKTVNGVYIYNKVTPTQIQYKKELKILSDIPKTIDITNFLKFSKKTKDIFSNNNTNISQYFYDKKYILQKRSSDVSHEAFISSVTNGLQNFSDVYGLYDDFILTEFVNGLTFNEYIKSDEFKTGDVIIIFVQIAIALYIAQQKCNFVHNDLTPWNIIIKILPKPVCVKYDTDKGTYSILTNIIPVIIDFGRAHIVYKDESGISEHYGNVNIFSSSTIQDILTLLVTSISVICSFDLCENDLNTIITIANFLTRTKYCTKPFTNGKNALGNLRFFFTKASKYTELITSNKFELEQKNPLDFVKYIMSSFQLENIKYESVEHESVEHESVDPDSKDSVNIISEDTFLHPEKVLSLLKNFPKNYKTIDIDTFRSINKSIFSKNLKYIKKLNLEELSEMFRDSIQQYMTIYSEIIKLC